MKTAKLLSAVAALGIVMSPVAAQANTRAGDSNVAYDDNGDRNGRHAGHRHRAFPRGLLIALGVGATGLALALALSNNANKSPGAN